MKKELIFFTLFLLSLNQPCNEYCVTCKKDMFLVSTPDSIPEFNEVEYCTQCIDGYFLDDSYFLNKGCIKRCKQSYNKSECKVCDAEKKDECFQCWEEYLPSKDRKVCEPQFAICGGEKFSDCMNCEENKNQNETIKCGKCRQSHRLINGTCVYDPAYYSKSKNINKNKMLIIIKSLLIILL